MTKFSVSATLTSPKPEPSKPELANPESEQVIRRATLKDVQSIYELSKKVTHQDQDSLTQTEDEVTFDYVHDRLSQSCHRGLCLLLTVQGSVIGYIQAYTPPFCCQAHVLSEATLLIDPDWQHQGFGSVLLESYLQDIQSTLLHIFRLEFQLHQTNHRGIQFLKHHGFVQESEAQGSIRTSKGEFEAEVTLVWFNSHFSEDKLKHYQAYLTCLWC